MKETIKSASIVTLNKLYLEAAETLKLIAKELNKRGVKTTPEELLKRHPKKLHWVE